MAKAKGEVPQEAVPPEFPEIAEHVWRTFLDLHNGRTYGMSGGNPISWEGMQAWCNLTGTVLSPWEIDTVKALDMVWMNVSSEGK